MNIIRDGLALGGGLPASVGPPGAVEPSDAILDGDAPDAPLTLASQASPPVDIGVETEDPTGDTEGASSPNAILRQWTAGEAVAACYAVLAANRRQSQSTVVERAEAAKNYYPKFVADGVKKGIWTSGKNGDPTVEDSVASRAIFVAEGKNKGKSPLLTNFQEVTKVVRNEILPLVKGHLGPTQEPPGPM
mmetsp:Transcript_13136/g.37008  ORF Transcript_13136/g.37008 Transcript_13136/m.37008 type:complete len:190 (-) Transcript_13136:63-632(-)